MDYEQQQQREKVRLRRKIVIFVLAMIVLFILINRVINAGTTQVIERGFGLSAQSYFSVQDGVKNHVVVEGVDIKEVGKNRYYVGTVEIKKHPMNEMPLYIKEAIKNGEAEDESAIGTMTKEGRPITATRMSDDEFVHESGTPIKVVVAFTYPINVSNDEVYLDNMSDFIFTDEAQVPELIEKAKKAIYWEDPNYKFVAERNVRHKIVEEYAKYYVRQNHPTILEYVEKNLEDLYKEMEKVGYSKDAEDSEKRLTEDTALKFVQARVKIDGFVNATVIEENAATRQYVVDCNFRFQNHQEEISDIKMIVVINQYKYTSSGVMSFENVGSYDGMFFFSDYTYETEAEKQAAIEKGKEKMDWGHPSYIQGK